MGWPLKEKDLKRYPHFDGVFPLAELERIATTPKRVAENPFFPFLLYYKSWQPFRKPDARPEKKRRPIRYAARKDSAIYSYYRHILSERYESLLRTRGLETCPIAYRKIPSATGKRGKCNIDFAADAFQKIRQIGRCCVVTLDISSYFECIDHARLRNVWCELIGATALPLDHARVFNAITRYAVVERNAAYERLGFIGQKQSKDGSLSIGFLKPKNLIPIQLCTPSDFRSKICGADQSLPSLIHRNKQPYGIPQGAPISDLLANIYLLEFDALVNQFVSTMGGSYYRYSDDIFVAIPGGELEGRSAAAYITDEIKKFGDQIKIKESKTAIVCFIADECGQLTAKRTDKPNDYGGLQYLGFRFDGRNVYIRESTMSRFHRNITRAAKARARALVRRYTGKDTRYLLQRFGIQEFEKKFGRVADFDDCVKRTHWTFRTYVKRCAQVFGTSGTTFFKQTRNHRRFITQTVTRELERALSRNAQHTTSR